MKKDTQRRTRVLSHSIEHIGLFCTARKHLIKNKFGVSDRGDSDGVVVMEGDCSPRAWRPSRNKKRKVQRRERCRGQRRVKKKRTNLVSVPAYFQVEFLEQRQHSSHYSWTTKSSPLLSWKTFRKKIHKKKSLLSFKGRGWREEEGEGKKGNCSTPRTANSD
jgi:hypothetical protein